MEAKREQSIPAERRKEWRIHCMPGAFGRPPKGGGGGGVCCGVIAEAKRSDSQK